MVCYILAPVFWSYHTCGTFDSNYQGSLHWVWWRTHLITGSCSQMFAWFTWGHLEGINENAPICRKSRFICYQSWPAMSICTIQGYNCMNVWGDQHQHGDKYYFLLQHPTNAREGHFNLLLLYSVDMMIIMFGHKYLYMVTLKKWFK